MALSEISFVLRGVPGTVAVEYGINDDPALWGQQLLQLPYDSEVARGCPVVRATVEHPAEGYGAELGWIQIIETGVPGRESATVDVPPQLADARVPWACWGVKPAFFDAPSTARSEFRFRADTFLAYTPDCLGTREAEPLCGFSWGYDVHAGKPSIAPLRTDALGQWPDARRLLTRHCPAWSFRAAGSNPDPSREEAR